MRERANQESRPSPREQSTRLALEALGPLDAAWESAVVGLIELGDVPESYGLVCLVDRGNEALLKNIAVVLAALPH